MGLIRKTMSLGTLGAVDFRSDKERTAAYGKSAARSAKKQTALLRDQNRMIAAQAQAEGVSQAAPTYRPGWYPDPHSTGYLRFHDGEQWTRNVQPMEAPPSNDLGPDWVPR